MDPNTNEDEWSDEQLGAALKRLDEMHRQLRALRTTIPRMIKPLTAPHDSPEELFRDFARAAETAVGEVKAFRRFRNDEKSRQALERAVASSKESREGITPWKATEHPNAFDPPEDEISDVVKDSEGAAINIQKGP
ncbi:hypothetical protein FGG08_003404 [Glutinoglossum americanum]|uniref:Uncharacterized protein n=1 Tax=Glutinoglossum americanum TaxID=1670608 RepID=A0A9P8I7D4_9PEZI|nr:hypothetical protein FGG08_003404 [Glutinoglossum americanum]